MTVETIPRSSALENDEFEALVKAVDLVCVTDADRDTLVSMSFSFNPGAIQRDGIRFALTRLVVCIKSLSMQEEPMGYWATSFATCWNMSTWSRMSFNLSRLLQSLNELQGPVTRKRRS